MCSLRPAQCHARPFVAEAADNAAARSDRTIAPCPVASFARPAACSANECHGSLRRQWCRVYSASQKDAAGRSEEHTSELQSLMRSSYAVFCLKKKKTKIINS